MHMGETRIQSRPGVPLQTGSPIQARAFPLRPLLVIVALLCAGCSSEISLLPAEEFRWCEDGPPVSFQPPPSSWKRSRHQSRDTGVAFVIADVPPGLITVGQILGLCKLDPRSALYSLQDRIHEFAPQQFAKAVHAARRFENSGHSDDANEMFTRVNSLLRDAQAAHRQGDMDSAAQFVDAAVVVADEFEYELDELLERYGFDVQEFDNPQDYNVEEHVSGSIDRLPSLAIRYTLDESRGLHHGRKVYVAWDNNLFVFSYLGPEKYLPVFEKMMETVRFPEGDATDVD